MPPRYAVVVYVAVPLPSWLTNVNGRASGVSPVPSLFAVVMVAPAVPWSNVCRQNTPPAWPMVAAPVTAVGATVAGVDAAGGGAGRISAATRCCARSAVLVKPTETEPAAGL